MRAPYFLVIAAVTGVVATGATPVAPMVAQAPLSGSFYQNTSGRKISSAMVAVSVYVRLADPAATNPWIGPVLTDQFGRFVFDDVPAGQYLLRAYDADGYRLWEQVVAVPSQMRAIVVRDIRVMYYPKSADGETVARTLQTQGYPYKEEPPENEAPTNSIWVGDAVPIDDVKRVASALINAGVRLTAIRRFEDGSGSKLKLVEVGSSPDHAALRPLQLRDVLTAKAFPRAL